MKFEQQQVGTVDVFTPQGPMVERDAERFTAVILERVRSSNPRVVIAMQEVAYLDSIAIEGLLDASDELASRASSLKLTSVTTTCREVLELTGVSSRFAFFEDVGAAVKSFL